MSLHRRNPSHEEDGETTVRTRVNSSPIPSPLSSRRTDANGPTSAPFRSPSFPASNSMPAMTGHSRTRSTSTPYMPPSPSPLSFSFPHNTKPGSDVPLSPVIASSAGGGRRHARIHSRNLSVFFPRPGSLPQTTISEDGAQEIEFHNNEEAPVMTIPSASKMHSGRHPLTPLGAGFSFGARPPSDGPTPTPPPMSATSSSSASRRGHHHKHSLSHNFFSFLEPGGQDPDSPSLRTQPTITPVSPWTPLATSGFPISPTSPSPTTQNGHAIESDVDVSVSMDPPVSAIAMAAAQFLLGGWLWVSGQQIGSLSATALGYWVVFDSFGVALSKVVPWRLHSTPPAKYARPYGNARMKTVLFFSQAVYLMFSSVYICKETVEHLLLSAGDGHHHHHGDEDANMGIEFPMLLTALSFILTIISAITFDNHASLVETAGNRIPHPTELIRSLSSSSQHVRSIAEKPTTRAAILLSNPYVCSPLAFCLGILFISTSVPASQHRTCDLVLSSIITFVTFNVAYRASTVLGTVLLQTAPRRGLPGGRMESFLRTMREVERHPQVLHLPAPHIWQLTAEVGKASAVPLVVNLELHVRQDLGDDDVVALTKWTWERCTNALGRLNDGNAAVEVTVGVVRG